MIDRRMELIAQGPGPDLRWRRPLPVGPELHLGRATATWAVPWDEQISRKHASVRRTEEGLEVTRLPDASNPIFVQGKEVDSAIIAPGEHFVIGGTTFTLVETQAMLSLEQPAPVAELRYSRRDLREARYRDADKRIDVLSRLPDLIQGASNDPELFSRVVNVLLMGVPRSDRAAIVAKVKRVEEKEGADSDSDSSSNRSIRSTGSASDGSSPIEILHWDSVQNATMDFMPSEQLIRQVLEKRESVIHIWHGVRDQPSSFTQGEDMDWAFCTPVPGYPCRDWVLYITGSFQRTEATPISDPADFQDDLKFAESAAAMLGYLREIRQLARDNAALTQVFSPRVIDVVSASDPDVVLAPRESEVTAMFCDLRGFSLHADRSADDLFGLLDRVSDALGVMTREILDNGGVIGDFQGDSVMAFWGWPLPEPNGPLQACRAALSIMREFTKGQRQQVHAAETIRQGEHALSGFACGIGIATGKAVAGRIGTNDQVKFTAFGPVVNLASRLEGMTKYWKAPVLMDETTAAAVRSAEDQVGRLRTICAVQPFGMSQQVRLTELLDSGELASLTDEHLRLFETGSAEFEKGNWKEAKATCEGLAAEDPVSQVILQEMFERGNDVPADWDGVLRMGTK